MGRPYAPRSRVLTWLVRMVLDSRLLRGLLALKAKEEVKVANRELVGDAQLSNRSGGPRYLKRWSID